MTAAELAAQLAARAARVGPEVERATRELGVLALSSSRRLMTDEIYAKPVDRRRNGKPKWTRTGALRRGERLEIRGPGEAVLVNDQTYAAPRHEANKPGRRQINPQRTAHWRDDMLKQIEGRRRQILAAMMQRILGGL